MAKLYFQTPFGQVHSSSGSLNQPCQFVGGEFYYRDEDLYLLGQRWYDSEVGRFVSRDELFSLNLYIYVGNNPINLIDPHGLKVEYCIKPTDNGGFPWVDHVFIRISGGKGCGFWPNGWPFGGHGKVEIPDPYNVLSIPCMELPPPPGVSPSDWDKCFSDFCQNMQNNPPRYIYGYHDCIWFADKAVEECKKKFCNK